LESLKILSSISSSFTIHPTTTGQASGHLQASSKNILNFIVAGFTG
jgi:hypothetical protein